MALQPGGYTDRPEDDNTPKAHPAFKRGKIKGILETLALLSNLMKDFVIFFALSSKEPAQPTQKRISGSTPFSFNSFKVGTFILIFKDLNSDIFIN